MEQVSVLETNIGSSTTGNSANTQIIFNDNGTLRGDAGLVYNKTTDALTVAGLVTAGSAAITGDLTVDTSTLKVDSTNNRVGVGTATPSVRMELSVADAVEGARLTASSAWLRFFPYLDATDKTKIQAVNGTNTALSDLTIEGMSLRLNTNAGLSYAISNASIHTWQNVGGFAGTAMTLNSTGLGIGASPVEKLTVAGKGLFVSANPDNSALKLEASTGTNSVAINFLNTGGHYFVGVDNSVGGRLYGVPYSLCIGSSGAFPVVIATNNTARLTVDSSGNVGIGVTPSAWTTFKVLQVGLGFIAASSGSTNARIFANTYYNGQYRYIANGAATEYEQDGYHAWKIAPSGTAGASAAVTSGQSYTVSVLGSSTLAQWQAFFSALAAIPTVGQVITATATGSIVGGGTVTQYINFTTAMTLDASGNLLVGTTSGTLFRIISSFLSSSGNGGIKLIDSQSNNTAVFANFSNGTGTLGSITNNGNAGVLYNVTSDKRLKENISDSESASLLIDSLQVRKFDWKANNSHQRYGFIAQELVTVVPEAVYQPTNSDDMMAVDYSKLVPMLVKEIQSLRTRVQTLEAR